MLSSLLSELSDASGIPITAVDLDSESKILVSISIQRMNLADALDLLLKTLPGSGLVIVGAKQSTHKNTLPDHIYVIVREGATGDGIDSSDRLTTTEENTVRSKNHSSLLQIINRLKQLLQSYKNSNGDADITQEQFHEWMLVLYQDALMWRILEQKLSPGEQKLVKQELFASNPQFYPELVIGPSAHLLDSYLRKLHQLFELNASGLLDGINTNKKWHVTRKVYALTQKRKRHSDVYLEIKLRNLFKDESVSLKRKIEAANIYVNSSDLSLSKYSAAYFEDLLEEELIPESEVSTIREFLLDVQKLR